VATEQRLATFRKKPAWAARGGQCGGQKSWVSWPSRPTGRSVSSLVTSLVAKLAGVQVETI